MQYIRFILQKMFGLRYVLQPIFGVADYYFTFVVLSFISELLFLFLVVF